MAVTGSRILTGATSGHAIARESRPVRPISWQGRLFNTVLPMIHKLVGAVTGAHRGVPDVVQARVQVRRFENVIASSPRGLKLVPISGAPCTADWVDMPGVRDDRIILFVHGGSFVLGSSNLHTSFIGRVCEAACARGLIVYYGLAPEHPFPAAIGDVTAMYRWLLAAGYRADRIQILGDSAGGGIALSALIRLRDEGADLPAGFALLGPWADLTLSGRSILAQGADKAGGYGLDVMMICRHLYLQGHSPADPLASPVFADLQDLPPLLIQVSTSDGLRDDSVRIAEGIENAGGHVQLSYYDQMPHGWQRLGRLLPESARSVAELAAFFTARFEHRPAAGFEAAAGQADEVTWHSND